MDTDVTPATRMPAPVLATAVLIGFFGGLTGLGALALGVVGFPDGYGPLIPVGLGVLIAAAVCVFGIVNRYRAAQIAAGVIGIFGMLGAIASLGQVNLLNLAWSAIAVTIGALVVIPMSARAWFIQTDTSIPLRVAITVAPVVIAALAAYLLMNGTLQWTDPAGNRACAMFSDIINPETGELDGTMDDAIAIAKQAKESKTAAIRATVSEFPGLADIGYDVLIDFDPLYAACVQAGKKMPPFSG